MENYKYSLTNKGKSICPKCGQKRFVLYINTETGKPLHSTVGKCDRADNCAHHYTPKQYFAENKISFGIDFNFIRKIGLYVYSGYHAHINKDSSENTNKSIHSASLMFGVRF